MGLGAAGLRLDNPYETKLLGHLAAPRIIPAGALFLGTSLRSAAKTP